ARQAASPVTGDAPATAIGRQAARPCPFPARPRRRQKVAFAWMSVPALVSSSAVFSSFCDCEPTPMNLPLLPVVAISAFVLVIAYLTYGRWVMRWLGIDPSRTTPAVEMEDGNDYVPAPAPVVLGGHFTAIAAAGPVVGPILAGLMFGWLPALLWILLGSIFIGGVHDSGALFASIRHRASSITQVVREHMSPWAYVLFLVFVWLCLVYVVIAFADVTAGTFASFTTE